MHIKVPRKIIIEADVAESKIAQNLRNNLPEAHVESVDRISEGSKHHPEVLEVVAFRGRLLKSCPGTRNYFCCGYRILHVGLQCSLGCTYCILQAYLNAPNLRLFGNTDDLLREVTEELASNPDQLYRFGTGEFTDSLLLDPWTGLSRLLVPFFARQPNAVLELKTKTNFVANLAELDHKGHSLVGWSLNAEHIRKHEESRTATIKERLKAAQSCADWGYRLSFHFDPMIEHPGWRNGYGEVLDRLFDSVDSSRIVWISLGAFRFMPELKSIIRSQHPSSPIVYGEFIKGLDGKMRYFRDIRVELYSFMVDRIRRIDPGIRVYLCMEGEDIWRESFGFSPEDRGGLATMLDKSVQTRMGVGTQCKTPPADR